MIENEISSRMGALVALEMWRLRAIEVNMVSPFRLVSGSLSPVYVNCRRLISYPEFTDLFVAASRIAIDKEEVVCDVVAGGETAGIPFAAYLARAIGKPLIYVRKQQKTHGLSTLIEGVLPSQSRVLLVEDLITDAGSKLGFIEALRREGAMVTDVLVVLDRLQGGAEALKAIGIKLHALTDMQTLLSLASSLRLIDMATLQSLQEYLRDPSAWNATRTAQ